MSVLERASGKVREIVDGVWPEDTAVVEPGIYLCDGEYGNGLVWGVANSEAGFWVNITTSDRVSSNAEVTNYTFSDYTVEGKLVGIDNKFGAVESQLTALNAASEAPTTAGEILTAVGVSRIPTVAVDNMTDAFPTLIGLGNQTTWWASQPGFFYDPMGPSSGIVPTGAFNSGVVMAGSPVDGSVIIGAKVWVSAQSVDTTMYAALTDGDGNPLAGTSSFAIPGHESLAAGLHSGVANNFEITLNLTTPLTINPDSAWVAVMGYNESEGDTVTVNRVELMLEGSVHAEWQTPQIVEITEDTTIDGLAAIYEVDCGNGHNVVVTLPLLADVGGLDFWICSFNSGNEAQINTQGGDVMTVMNMNSSSASTGQTGLWVNTNCMFHCIAGNHGWYLLGQWD